MAGYRFETGIVDDMLATLEATPGALPLLQFAAAKLWEARDRKRRVLTRDSYHAMGGVAGALASHADEAARRPHAAAISGSRARCSCASSRRSARARSSTRASCASCATSRPRSSASSSTLVDARLLVVQTRGDGEGAARRDRPRVADRELAARCGAGSTRTRRTRRSSSSSAPPRSSGTRRAGPQGLLWRGEAMEEARRWRSRYRGELPPREPRSSTRCSRSRRAQRAATPMVVAAIGLLSALVAAAGVGLIVVREHPAAARRAEQQARDNEATARKAQQQAEQAESKLEQKVEELTAAQAARDQADEAKRLADAEKERTRKEKDVIVRQAATTEQKAERATRQARDAVKVAAEEARKKKGSRRQGEARRAAQKIETRDRK